MSSGEWPGGEPFHAACLKLGECRADDDEPEPVLPGVATPRWDSEVFYDVVDALDEIPCLGGEHSRAIVVDTLHFGGYVRYAPSRRAHITSILRTCLDHEDGVMELVRAIANLEPTGSVTVKRLVTLLFNDVPLDRQVDR